MLRGGRVPRSRRHILPARDMDAVTLPYSQRVKHHGIPTSCYNLGVFGVPLKSYHLFRPTNFTGHLLPAIIPSPPCSFPCFASSPDSIELPYSAECDPAGLPVTASPDGDHPAGRISSGETCLPSCLRQAG